MTTPFSAATTRSRNRRDATDDAIIALEAALSAPTPAREHAWRDDVVEALDVLISALDRQSESDLGPDSLLEEIGRDQPRLIPRIERLQQEHADLRTSATSLRDQIVDPEEEPDVTVDTADMRDRLAAVALRYRRHRARESDLVYEAINVDLGAGD